MKTQNTTKGAGNTTAAQNEIKIKATFSTLTEAVEFAGIDLSYNEREARRTIKDIETAFDGRGGWPPNAFYVSNENEVFYVWQGYDIGNFVALPMLNKFDAFTSVLSDGKLGVAAIGKDKIRLTNQIYKKSKEGREQLGQWLHELRTSLRDVMSKEYGSDYLVVAQGL